MDNIIPSREKCPQRDDNLGFKLAVVDQVEKGELTHEPIPGNARAED